MNRIILVFLALLTSLAYAADRKPNIVWIMTEDWDTTIGCYGHPEAKTPNIDKLASQGRRYTTAWCTAPVCSTSRSAMATGYHQDFIRSGQHRTAKKDMKPLPDGIQTVPELLKENGYFTCLMLSKKTDWNFLSPDPWMGSDWKQREAGQPFFAQITLQVSHRKFKRDKEHPVDPASVKLPPYYPDCALIRRDWADGLESLQIADRQVGGILERLDDEGLAENTIVFFIGDNGLCHARGKQFLYEEGLHVPFIVRWPGRMKPEVRTELASTLDIPATILAAVGIQPAVPLHGRDLMSPESTRREHIFAARGKMDNTHDAMRAVRGKRYKLIHNLMPERAWCQLNQYKEGSYPALAVLNVLHLEGRLTDEQDRFMADHKPEFELYDLENDPYELHNLADDPDHAGQLAGLKKELAGWRKEIRDPGVSPKFRKGGWPASYPTRGLDEWKKQLHQWEKKLGVPDALAGLPAAPPSKTRSTR
ncbi:MAG: sulfatase [Akkermansiaceae bacterium]|nr:sulfatase [Akkermansiaceae bacterium]